MEFRELVYDVCGKRLNVEKNFNESLISLGLCAEEILYIIFGLLDNTFSYINEVNFVLEKASMEEIVNKVGLIKR